VKNDKGVLRMTHSVSRAARREIKTIFVRRHWALMNEAIKEDQSEKFLRMTFPKGSQRKDVVDRLRKTVPYAPSSVDYDIWNCLLNIHREISRQLEVITPIGKWKPKNLKTPFPDEQDQ
jgi:hypothetical protein